MINTLDTYSIHDDFAAIRDIWTGLTRQLEVPFFLSWGWMENWISSLPGWVKVFLIVGKEANQPKIAFFVGVPPPIRRRFIIIKKSLYLNSTGIPDYDNLYIEYNSILFAPGFRLSLKEILHLLPFEWEEFVMPGLDVSRLPVNSISHDLQPYNVRVRNAPSFFVDLEKVRECNGNYLGLLSSNTRRQIRRSISLYNEKGKICTTVADTLNDALEFFDELIKLHKISWEERKEASSFCSTYFIEFHVDLIKKRFSNGEIQLLKVKCGDTTIGCLYNFIFNKVVYFYQCGFVNEDDNKLKPGLITHVEAIKHNAECNNITYDFLAGDSQYKRSLATDNNELAWVVLQKNIFKFNIENFSRKILRKISIK